MKEAMYYEKLRDEFIKCNLCPHFCIIGKDEFGKCKTRKNRDGVLYTVNKNHITSMAYDPIEKKPLYEFMEGSNILSIGNYGCNFKCEFCQNHEIVYNPNTMIRVSEDEIVRKAKEKNSVGLAYTYNEPTVWYESMLSLAKKVKDKGLVNVMITNGFINEEPLLELLPYIDAMNIDLKAFNKEFYKSICDGKLDPVKKTIQIASQQVHIEISTLLIDERNTDEKEIERLAKFISSIDKDIPLHLNRYYPSYKMKDNPTDIDTLVKSKKIAKRYLNNIYIGNVPGLT